MGVHRKCLMGEHHHYYGAGFDETFSMTVRLVRGTGAISLELAWEPVPGDLPVTVIEDMSGEPLPERRVTWAATAEFVDGHTVTGTCEPSDRNHEDAAQLACVALLEKLGLNVAVIDVDGG